QALKQLDAELHAAAQEPALLDVLNSRDPEQIRVTERRLSYRDGMLDAHLNRRGEATQNPSRAAPINFAALDMLRRIENGQSVAAEAYRLGQRWVVYKAVPLRAEPQGPAEGTLLFAVDIQRLLAALPAIPGEIGELRLTQQFPNAPEQLLAGGGAADQALTFDSGNLNWQVGFIPGPQLKQPLISPLLA